MRLLTAVSLVRVQLGEGSFERMKEMEEGSVVKRLRHRPFTAVTRVRFPSESVGWKFLKIIYGVIAKW